MRSNGRPMRTLDPSEPLSMSRSWAVKMGSIDRTKSNGQTTSVHYVLFDIDGTLTQSQSIDAEIYLRSLAEVFGFTDVGADWSSYRHTTDSGILHEIFENAAGERPRTWNSQPCAG